AAYHLSLEYSAKRLGSQTLADKQKELEALDSFRRIDQQGGLLRHVVDQSLVEEWRADAEERHTLAESANTRAAIAAPVSIDWTPSNSGWNGAIQIAEPTLEVHWNLLGQSAPVSTGLSPRNDPRTGRPTPNLNLPLPAGQADATIEIRYTDLSGAERGPFRLP